jgi:Domain of unknown function (DUF4203)
MRTAQLALADPSARLVAFLLGVVLLVLGRRLFWLFVGLVGFFTVYRASLDSLHLHPSGLRLALALAAGLFGVLLAIFVQRVAVAVAGFLVGGALAASFLGFDLGHALTAPPWVAVIVLVVGIVAAFLALRLFDLALIVLSALVGAGLVADAAHWAGPSRLALVLLLALAGMAVQAGWTARRAGERAR